MGGGATNYGDSSPMAQNDTSRSMGERQGWVAEQRTTGILRRWLRMTLQEVWGNGAERPGEFTAVPIAKGA